jgi:hypothetical protein
MDAAQSKLYARYDEQTSRNEETPADDYWGAVDVALVSYQSRRRRQKRTSLQDLRSLSGRLVDASSAVRIKPATENDRSAMCGPRKKKSRVFGNL